MSIATILTSIVTILASIEQVNTPLICKIMFLFSLNYFENQLVTTVGDGKASGRLI